MKIFLSLVCAIVLASIANAATYYVRTDGHNGATGLNNTNNATSGAWLTIQHAADTAVAGDFVTVANGTYPESVASGHSGSNGSPVTFTAQSLSVIVYSWRFDHAYNTIDGLKIDGTTLPDYSMNIGVHAGGNHTTIQNCLVTNTAFQGYNINIPPYDSSVTYLTVTNCEISECSGTGISLYGSNHLVTGSYFHSTKAGDCLRIFGDNITVRGNRFIHWDNVDQPTYHTDLIQTFNFLGDSVTCQNFVFEQNLVQDCIFCSMGDLEDNGGLGNFSHWTYRNNLFIRIPEAVKICIPDFYAYNNTFYQCTTATAMNLGYRNLGIRFPFTTAQVNTSANTITATGTLDFVTGAQIQFYNSVPAPMTPSGGVPIVPYFGPDIYGLTVTVAAAGKTFTRASGSWIDDGFVLGGYVTFEGCVNSGNNSTFLISTITGTVLTFSTASGLVNETSTAGIHGASAYFARITTGSTFTVHPTAADANANTRIIDLTTTGSDSPAMGVGKYQARGVGNNGKVYNNIFVECGINSADPEQGWYLAATSGAEPVTGFLGDYNLVIGTGAGTIKTGALWTSDGRETHGINGSNPLFISSTNFALRAGSPCIGTGTNLSATFTNDITGATRTIPWTLGAYTWLGTAGLPGSQSLLLTVP